MQKKVCQEQLRERWAADAQGSAAACLEGLERRLAECAFLDHLSKAWHVLKQRSAPCQNALHCLARRLDAQELEPPAPKREMLSAVREITRKKAAVTAALQALLAGIAVPSACSAQAAGAHSSESAPLAADYRAADAQHGGFVHPPGLAPPAPSLEAHIQAYQGCTASPAATSSAAGPQSWKRRFWELHREQEQQRQQQHQPQPKQQQQQQHQLLQQHNGLPHPGHLQPPSDGQPAALPQMAAQAGAALGNVVPFRPAGARPQRGGLGGPDDPDPRPIVLFDLNGTLTSHTAKRRSAGANKMRPGTPHLRRLQVRPVPTSAVLNGGHAGVKCTESSIKALQRLFAQCNPFSTPCGEWHRQEQLSTLRL